MKILKILNEKFFSKSKSEANKLEKDFHNYLSRFVVNIFSVKFTDHILSRCEEREIDVKYLGIVLKDFFSNNEPYISDFDLSFSDKGEKLKKIFRVVDNSSNLVIPVLMEKKGFKRKSPFNITFLSVWQEGNYSSRYKEGHQKEASKFGSYKEIKYVETGLSKHLFFGE